MKHILLPLLFTLFVPSTVLEGAARTDKKKVADGQSRSSNEQAQIDEIRRIESDRLAAGVRKDIEAVSAATAEDYLQIDLDGNVLDKAATLQRIKSSFAQLQSNPVDDKMVVRIYGDTAVITGRAAPKGTINGTEFVGAIRYSRVYVKRGGRWQVVLFQQTRIAQDK